MAKRLIYISLLFVVGIVLVYLLLRLPPTVAIIAAVLAVAVAVAAISVAILARGQWRWPEYVVTILGAALLVWLAQFVDLVVLQRSAASEKEAAATVSVAAFGLLPLPATQFVGGTGPLAAGRFIDLFASTNAAGTPIPAKVSYAEVSELRTKEGLSASADRSNVDTVILKLPEAALPTVQAILLQKDAKFAYTILAGPATMTPVPTATSPPTPITPTVTPEAGLVYLTLPAANIASGADRVVAGPHKMVIVSSGPPGLTPVPGATPPVYSACVKVVGFLDKNDFRTGAFSKDNTTQLLLTLTDTELVVAVPALARAESIWLVPGAGCGQ
jgi:hypothetical protein